MTQLGLSRLARHKPRQLHALSVFLVDVQGALKMFG
jgi:hypothetical protein